MNKKGISIFSEREVIEIIVPALPLWNKVREFNGEKYLTFGYDIYKPTGKKILHNGKHGYEYKYSHTEE